MEGKFTLGCDENGIFTGLDCEIYLTQGHMHPCADLSLREPALTP